MGRGTVAAGWRAGLLALFGLLLVSPPVHGASIARQCRRACTDEIAACVASGGQKRQCRRDTLARCRTEGLQVCAAGQSPPTGQTAAWIAPSAPSSLRAAAVSTSAINLAWSNTSSTKVTSFSIERSMVADSGFQAIASASGNQASYQDPGLVSSTTYYYRVRAFSRRGTSSTYSNVANATTFALATTTTLPTTTSSTATTLIATTTTSTSTTTTLPAPPPTPTGLKA